MAGDGTPAPTPNGATKELTLLTRDLAMFASASSYNLKNPAELRRSAEDLRAFFFDVAKALEPDLYIEAGAKNAASSRRARKFLDPKRIVAFEANPYTHEYWGAKHDNAAQGVEYLHLALTDRPGDVTFNVNRSAEGEPIIDGRGSLFKQEKVGHGFIEVTVEATTLDTFFADHDYSRSALWVDVEGALESVFDGGPNTLDKAGVVIVEIEERSKWGAQQWLRDDVVSRLYDHGLVPVARDYQSRYQYNIVFIRQTLLDSTERLRWILARHLSNAGNGRPDPKAKRPAAAKADGSVSGAAQSATSAATPGPVPLRRLVPKPIRTALHPAYKAVRAAAGR